MSDWEAHYASGAPLPWDTGTPDPLLVGHVREGSGRALDVGCGTGTNTRWLAEQGFEALGIDVSPSAIERARARGGARFEVVDFLTDTVEGRFDLVFDRGCFHVFDSHDERDRFAAHVARLLAPGGRWLSLIGSPEGPPRQHGPPRRSARDVVAAVEPHLAVRELRAVRFEAHDAEAWLCVAVPR